MSNTMTIYVDDTDPAISYSGNWLADRGSVDNIGNGGATYMGTTHYTKGTGSFSFTFYGTYVGIFGTTLDGTNPSRRCTVDGVVIPNNDVTWAANGVMHCQINGLKDGKHTIVVTVPTANANGYWFDSISYIPSASVSRADAVLNIINGDPSFSYGTGWATNGPGYSTSKNGATVSVQFTGRHLAWMGYYLSGDAFAATTATYTIDGKNPTTFSLNGIKAQRTGAEFGLTFFSTPLLSPGQHTLTVVYNGNSGTTPLSVYNVIVQNGASATGSVASGNSGSGANSGGSGANSGGGGAVVSSASPTTVTVIDESQAAVTTVTTGGSTVVIPTGAPAAESSVLIVGTGSAAVTITIAPNSTATQTVFQGPVGLQGSGITETVPGSSGLPGSSGPVDESAGTTIAPGGQNTSAVTSHNNVGAIVGAVLGTIIVIILLLLAFFFLRRQKRKRVLAEKLAESNDITVDPFTDSLRVAALGTPGAPALASSSHLLEPADSLNTFVYPNEKLEPLRYAAHSSSNSTTTSPSTPGHPVPEIIMIHKDSGTRIPHLEGQPAAAIVEMPPTYSAT